MPATLKEAKLEATKVPDAEIIKLRSIFKIGSLALAVTVTAFTPSPIVKLFEILNVPKSNVWVGPPTAEGCNCKL